MQRNWLRSPDVILASNSQATLALQAATSTVPIVFAKRHRSRRRRLLRQPDAAGRKWLELLKQIAPGMTRVAVLRATGVSPNSEAYLAGFIDG